MFRGILLVFLGACSFGILSTFVKLAYADGFTLGEVTGSQVLFGFIMLWLLVLVRQLLGKLRSTAGKAEKLKLVLLGTSTGLVSIFYYKCVELIPASVAILLLMQFTWMSLLLDCIMQRRLPTLVQVLTVLLVLTGTALAARIGSNTTAFTNLEGVFYGLLAAACYTVFIYISGSMGKNLHPATRSAYILTGATIIVLIIFPPAFLMSGALTAGLWKWGLILSVFGTVLPPLLYAYGIPKIGVSLSAILSSAELPVAVLMSSLVLGEEVWAIQWFGVVLILAAIVASNVWSYRKKRVALKEETISESKH